MDEALVGLLAGCVDEGRLGKSQGGKLLPLDCVVGVGSRLRALHVWVDLTPGLVTLAYMLIDPCGKPPAAVARFAPAFGAAFEAIFVTFLLAAVFLGFRNFSSQSCILSGTPTLTKVSRTQALAGFVGSNVVGPRFLGAFSSSISGNSSSDSGSGSSSSGSSLSRLIFTSSIGV